MLDFFFLFMLIAVYICSSAADDSIVWPFQSWTLSDATLTSTTESVYAAYNSIVDPDCIYVFDGVSCHDCVQCYNVSNDSISTYDTLSLGGYSFGKPAVIFKDSGLAYFITSDAALRVYDIPNKNATHLLTISDITQPCLAMNTLNNNEIYIQGAATTGTTGNEDPSDKFYIYYTNNNSLIEGESLTFARTHPSCIVADNNGIDSNDPYLWIIGGESTYIERKRLKNDGIYNNRSSMDATLGFVCECVVANNFTVPQNIQSTLHENDCTR